MASEHINISENSTTGSGLDMSPELMRELADRTAELLIEWNVKLPEMHAWDGDFRHSLEDGFMEEPPESGRSAHDVLEQAASQILPMAARHQHPRFFAFVPSTVTWPSILADFLISGFNINACTWLSASGPSQIELVVVSWFCRWLGYSEMSGGLFTSGGSVAAVDAFVAAREAARPSKPATVYLSDQTHSSIVRAARIVGIAPENIRTIPSDENFRLDLEALYDAVAKDRAEDLQPIAISANAGTANTGTIDPLNEIADFCEAERMWMHVDAAYGGFAVVTENGKDLLHGINRADSIGLDAHKWFFQPYEAGCLLVKSIETLENAFRIPHDILQDTVWGADHVNISDLGPQLSRSFRALKVWMSIQTFGMDAFRKAVARTMQLANDAGRFVTERPALELLCPVTLGIVCFRVNPQEQMYDESKLESINRTVLARVFWEDPALISSTKLGEAFALRLCILNHNTSWNDVRETLEAIENFGIEAIAKENT